MRPPLPSAMRAIENEEVLDPLLPGAQATSNRNSSRFSLRSNVTITVPLWFVFVVCFAVLMMVILGTGFLYAVVMAEPAVITIGEILSHSDVLVKSMVASSVNAIANGNELVRFATFSSDQHASLLLFSCLPRRLLNQECGVIRTLQGQLDSSVNSLNATKEAM